MAILGLFGPTPSSGAGSTQSPPPPPPPGESASTQTTTDTRSGSTSGSSQTTGNAAEGPGAATTVPPVQQRSATAQTGAPATATNAVSQPRQAPTPLDAPAVRADFSAEALAGVQQSETAARKLALDAQASARVTAVLDTLARPVEAPSLAVERPVAPVETSSAQRDSGPPAFNQTLKTLRGQDAPTGQLLDRAA